jgi:hypothetical protein
MNKIYAALAAIGVCLAFGCATEATHEEANKIEISHYRTFAIAPLATGSPSSDPGAGLRLADTARQSLLRGLTEKGFAEAPSDQADFIAELVGQFKPDPFSETSEQRTLIIKIIDRPSGREVWSNSRGRSGSKTLTPEQLSGTIDALLEPMPTAANVAGK